MGRGAQRAALSGSRRRRELRMGRGKKVARKAARERAQRWARGKAPPAPPDPAPPTRTHPLALQPRPSPHQPADHSPTRTRVASAPSGIVSRSWGLGTPLCCRQMDGSSQPASLGGHPPRSPVYPACPPTLPLRVTHHALHVPLHLPLHPQHVPLHPIFLLLFLAYPLKSPARPPLFLSLPLCPLVSPTVPCVSPSAGVCAQLCVHLRVPRCVCTLCASPTPSPTPQRPPCPLCPPSPLTCSFPAILLISTGRCSRRSGRSGSARVVPERCTSAGGIVHTDSSSVGWLKTSGAGVRHPSATNSPPDSSSPVGARVSPKGAEGQSFPPLSPAPAGHAGEGPRPWDPPGTTSPGCTCGAGAASS